MVTEKDLIHCSIDEDASIEDLYDQGYTEDDLRDDPATRDRMNDPDSPHYNG